MLLGIPYATIAFALRPLPVLRRFGRFGDFSFGAYIYAFPIQQAIMHFRPAISMAAFAALSVLLAVAAGAFPGTASRSAPCASSAC